MTFYLGTHETGWLSRAGVPLFVSRRRLARRTTLPVAMAPWALDSGGFTELNLNGRWETSPQQYAGEALRYAAEIGRLDWAAIQDWMCEPVVLAKTGKSIAEHQELSTASYLDLTWIAPDVPWCPVVQGWHPDDYLAHIDLYRSAGVNLTSLPIVGVGSVCRRQGTREVRDIFAGLRGLGLNLHGFGLKVQGLRRCARMLESADSLAWSFRARKERRPMDGCTHSSCANCLRFALAWRKEVLSEIARPQAMPFLW